MLHETPESGILELWGCAARIVSQVPPWGLGCAAGLVFLSTREQARPQTGRTSIVYPPESIPSTSWSNDRHRQCISRSLSPTRLTCPSRRGGTRSSAGARCPAVINQSRVARAVGGRGGGHRVVHVPTQFWRLYYRCTAPHRERRA